MTTSTLTTDRPDLDAIRSALAFTPTAAQRPVLDSRHRYTLVTGGEQAGKSRIGAQYLLERLPETTGKGLYWIVGADYDRTSAEYWYLRDDLDQQGFLKTASKRVDPGTIELLDGTKIMTKSAKDPRTLAQVGPDGILLCEADTTDLETYSRCNMRTGPKRGWLFMIGTLESSLGWFPSLAAAWINGTPKDERSYRLPTPSNSYLYPGGESDPEIQRIRATTSDDFFNERMMGLPAPPKGAVFAAYFRPDVHIHDFDWDPNHPVRLWIDPGYAGAYSVLAVQIIDGQVRIFDEIYEQGLVTEEIIGICMQREWWRGDNMVPGAIDIAGTQHQAMPAPTEMWLSKANYVFTAQKVGVNDGIERMKAFLKVNPITNTPSLLMSHRCKGLISELGGSPNPFDGTTKVYKWKIDKDGNIVGETPDDKWNHSCKAVAYGLVAQFGYGVVGGGRRIKVKHW